MLRGKIVKKQPSEVDKRFLIYGVLLGVMGGLTSNLLTEVLLRINPDASLSWLWIEAFICLAFTVGLYIYIIKLEGWRK